MADHTFFGFPIIAPVTFEDDHTRVFNRTLSRGVDSLRRPGQAWRVSFALEASNRILPFTKLVELGSDSFAFPVPQPDDPAVEKGALTVATSALSAVDSTTVSVDLPVGRFVRFDGHDKVYLVVSGNGTTSEVYPRLRSGVASGETVYYGDNVTMTVLLDEPQEYSFTFSDGVLNDHTRIHLIEDV